MTKLKILAGHPVQYLAPLYRALASAGMDVEVGYYHRGAAGRVAHDAEFGIDFQWDLDLLEGYRRRVFLDETASYSAAEQARLARRILPWALRDRETPLLLVGWFSEIVWLIWLLRVLNRAPTLTMSDTTVPSYYNAGYKPRWRVGLLQWLLRHTQANVYVGARNREFLMAMGVPAEQLWYVPFSVDNNRFAAGMRELMPRRADLCREHGLDPDSPVLLFCGKLVPNKRPLELLEAYLAAGLKDRAQLLYVGDGMLRTELLARAEAMGAPGVRVAGFFNQTQMPAAYVMGQLLCLISHTEPWGLVANEALACGRPLLLADTVGCAPDLGKEGNGWVTRAEDPADLAQTLACAFDRRDQWPAMGERGREVVAGHTYAAMARGITSAVEAIRRAGKSAGVSATEQLD